MTLQDLIEKLEALEGPDRDVDVAIWRSVMGGNPVAFPMPWDHCYTSCVTAALSLVPEGWRLNLWGAGKEWCAYLADRDEQHPNVRIVRSDDIEYPAIALCIASLRARSHLKD
jgi:hypothetical protein